MVLTIQVLNLNDSDSKAVVFVMLGQWARGFDVLCSDEIVLKDQWDLFTHIPRKYFINTGAMANYQASNPCLSQSYWNS